MDFVAMVATPETPYDIAWYLDSSASSHVIVDYNNLMHKTDYARRNQLHVGNETGLNIKLISQSFFKSPFNPSRSLTLQNLLMCLP